MNSGWIRTFFFKLKKHGWLSDRVKLLSSVQSSRKYLPSGKIQQDILLGKFSVIQLTVNKLQVWAWGLKGRLVSNHQQALFSLVLRAYFLFTLQRNISPLGVSLNLREAGWSCASNRHLPKDTDLCVRRCWERRLMAEVLLYLLLKGLSHYQRKKEERRGEEERKGWERNWKSEILQHLSVSSSNRTNRAYF